MQAAVDMMRKVLNTVNMDGVIVIGEGEKDEVQKLHVSHAIALNVLLSDSRFSYIN